MVGVSDLAQPIGDVDAAWQPGPYRFSVVCLGGGRVRVTVGTRPKTEWTAPCNGTVSARESVTTPRVLDLSLTGEAGATGPVGYRADRLPRHPHHLSRLARRPDSGRPAPPARLVCPTDPAGPARPIPPACLPDQLGPPAAPHGPPGSGPARSA